MQIALNFRLGHTLSSIFASLAGKRPLRQLLYLKVAATTPSAPERINIWDPTTGELLTAVASQTALVAGRRRFDVESFSRHYDGRRVAHRFQPLDGAPLLLVEGRLSAAGYPPAEAITEATVVRPAIETIAGVTVVRRGLIRNSAPPDAEPQSDGQPRIPGPQAAESEAPAVTIGTLQNELLGRKAWKWLCSDQSANPPLPQPPIPLLNKFALAPPDFMTTAGQRDFVARLLRVGHADVRHRAIRWLVCDIDDLSMRNGARAAIWGATAVAFSTSAVRHVLNNANFTKPLLEDALVSVPWRVALTVFEQAAQESSSPKSWAEVVALARRLVVAVAQQMPVVIEPARSPIQVATSQLAAGKAQDAIQDDPMSTEGSQDGEGGRGAQVQPVENNDQPNINPIVAQLSWAIALDREPDFAKRLSNCIAVCADFSGLAAIDSSIAGIDHVAAMAEAVVDKATALRLAVQSLTAAAAASSEDDPVRLAAVLVHWHGVAASLELVARPAIALCAARGLARRNKPKMLGAFPWLDAWMLERITSADIGAVGELAHVFEVLDLLEGHEVARGAEFSWDGPAIAAAPPAGEEVGNYLRRALDEHLEHATVPIELRPWATAQVGAGWPRSVTFEICNALRDYSSALGDRCRQELLTELANETPDQALLNANWYMAKVRELEPHLRSVATMPFALLTRPPRTLGEERPVPEPANSSELVIAVEKFGDPPALPDLRAVQADIHAEFYTVMVPVRLQLAGPQPGFDQASVIVEPVTDVFSRGLPQTAQARNATRQVFRVPWHADPVTTVISGVLPVIVAIRLMRLEGELLRIRVTVDCAGKTVTAEFSAGRVVDERELGFAGRATGLDPRLAESSPVGPQVKRDEVLERLANGGSCFIVAPRRFGKTTLLQSIEQGLEEGHTGKGRVLPIRLNALTGGAGAGHAGIWAQVTASISSAKKLGLQGWSLLNQAPGPWPSLESFELPRRVARERGYHYIALLIDEAQMLFPPGDSSSRGAIVKQFLEDAAPDGRLAGIELALFGLPTLEARAGANLIGAGRLFKANDFPDTEITALIAAQTTNGLATTKRVRDILRKHTYNIIFLQHMVEGLVRIANSEGRRWVTGRDADAVVKQMYAEIANRTLANTMLLRDAFSAGETVDDWRPTEAWPIALAVAKHLAGQAGNVAAAPAVSAVLGGWIRRAWTDLPQQQLLAPADDLVKKVLQDLVDSDVLDRTKKAIKSDLMRQYLNAESGRVDAGDFDDPEFGKAIQKLVTPRIQLPVDVAQVAAGGQATIWVAPGKDGQPDEAYRVWRLPQDDWHERLLRDRQVAGKIISAHRRNAAGFDRVFHLLEIGLHRDDTACGVQRYTWVPGEPLARRSLAPATALAVGRQLFETLAAIHEEGILHRDLKPDNIIISSTDFRPTLIDFGLARVSSSEMATRVTGPCVAPEVGGSAVPLWTGAADVYAMASTLAEVARKPDGIVALLEPALAVNPALRPSAKEMARVFASAERRAEHHKVLAAANTQAVAAAGHSADLAGAVGDCRLGIDAIAAGIIYSDLAMAMQVGDLVNRLCERLHREQSITDLVNKGILPDAARELARLRNRKVHAARRSEPPLLKVPAEVMALTETVAAALRQPALAAVVQVYYDIRRQAAAQLDTGPPA